MRGATVQRGASITVERQALLTAASYSRRYEALDDEE